MRRTSVWAVISLICAILGLGSKGTLAIPGLVCGYVALNEIRSSGGTVGGEGLAKAGIIISFLVIGLAVLVFVLVVVLGVTYLRFLNGALQTP